MRVLKCALLGACALLLLLAGCTSPETPEESQPFSAPSQGGAPEREPSSLPEPQGTSPLCPRFQRGSFRQRPLRDRQYPCGGPHLPFRLPKAFGEGDGCRLVQNRQGERGLS